jgi:hypothetical protein
MSVKSFGSMTWRLLRSAAQGYMADNALSRGWRARLPSSGLARDKRCPECDQHPVWRVVAGAADCDACTELRHLAAAHRGIVRRDLQGPARPRYYLARHAVGAITTALLFDIGKVLISMYIGSSSVASTYGTAGTLAVLLRWIYYSSQIFLFGAEFTRAYAEMHGSFAGRSIKGRPTEAAVVVSGSGKTSQEAGPADELEDLKRQLRAARR